MYNWGIPTMRTAKEGKSLFANGTRLWCLKPRNTSNLNNYRSDLEGTAADSKHCCLLRLHLINRRWQFNALTAVSVQVYCKAVLEWLPRWYKLWQPWHKCGTEEVEIYMYVYHKCFKYFWRLFQFFFSVSISFKYQCSDSYIFMNSYGYEWMLCVEQMWNDPCKLSVLSSKSCDKTLWKYHSWEWKIAACGHSRVTPLGQDRVEEGIAGPQNIESVKKKKTDLGKMMNKGQESWTISSLQSGWMS